MTPRRASRTALQGEADAPISLPLPLSLSMYICIYIYIYLIVLYHILLYAIMLYCGTLYVFYAYLIISHYIISKLLRSIFEISSCFFGPRPWHIEIRHRVKKTSTINSFGFETLKLRIRRLKFWKPTVYVLQADADAPMTEGAA